MWYEWTLAGFCLGLFLFIVIPDLTHQPNTTRERHQKVKVMVMLGSGGHTAEMMSLVKCLPLERYKVSLVLVSSGDTSSIRRAQELKADVKVIPRARKVHQSWFTTPWSSVISLYESFRLMWMHKEYDLLLMNGPGTCVPLVLSILALRVLHKKTPTCCYIESFARVSSLSLSGKLIQSLVDDFVVQWPALAVSGVKYEGCLI